jgi:hypothetical protein
MKLPYHNKTLFLVLLVYLLLPDRLFSQIPVNQMGGRAFGVAGASVTYQDVWSQYHNQAGLAYLKGINFGLAFQNAFFVKELSTKSVAFALPLKSGVFGLNYYYFGYPKFNENKFGLAFSKLLSKRIAVGIQLDYLYTHIDGEYGQKGIAAGEIGLLTEPVDNLFIGAHVFNLWHSKLSSYENEYLPTIFKMGASYHLYQKALLSIEFEKDLESDFIFRTGLELELIKLLYFRAGIATNPNIYSFGLGYTFSSFEFNIAFSKHPVLDYSPSISIVYAFKDRL